MGDDEWDEVELSPTTKVGYELTVLFEADDAAALDAITMRDGTTAAQAVRLAVRAYASQTAVRGHALALHLKATLAAESTERTSKRHARRRVAASGT